MSQATSQSGHSQSGNGTASPTPMSAEAKSFSITRFGEVIDEKRSGKDVEILRFFMEISDKQRETEKGREGKWLHMLQNWQHFTTKEADHLYTRVCKGIPASLRAKAWPKLCRSEDLMVTSPSLFTNAVAAPCPEEHIILLDIRRTLPNIATFQTRKETLAATAPEGGSSALAIVVSPPAPAAAAAAAAPVAAGDFSGASAAAAAGPVTGKTTDDSSNASHLRVNATADPGRGALFETLKAFCNHNPSLGYCQGISFVAGCCVMYMGAEASFYLLQTLLFHPRFDLKGLYEKGFPLLRRMIYYTECLLDKHEPKIMAHLRAHNFDLMTLLPQWYICLFTYNLPFALVTRIWDVLMAKGPEVLYQVTVSIIAKAKRRILSETTSEGLMEFMCHTLLTLPDVLDTPDEFIHSVLKVEVKPKYFVEYAKKYEAVLAAARKQQEELAAKRAARQAALAKASEAKAAGAASAAPSPLPSPSPAPAPAAGSASADAQDGSLSEFILSQPS